MSDDVAVIIGTRPEAIKLAGVVRQLGPAARVVHTGQHYDAAMWHGVVDDLDALPIAAGLQIGGRTRADQLGIGIGELGRYLTEDPARVVVVQGDTNSTLAGAIAASATGTPLVHVEAGLRSHDRRMPEEINRVLVDAIADLCCAPIAANADQLAQEGVGAERIVITGNTLGDALATLLPDAAERRRTLADRDLSEDGYVLSTIHRAEVTADRDRLLAAASALAGLAEVAPVVLPMHPRTRAALERHGLTDTLGGVRVIDPLPPREFLTLEAHAALLVSDSGGVQEEACLLRRPLVVLRDSTERPELLDGWCRLVGDDDPRQVIADAWRDREAWRAELAGRELPYGGESASRVIVAEIERRWPPR